MTEFSMKELYDVYLKATYPMEINGKSFEVGDIVASFDKIQIANFTEVKSAVAATGGYDNRSLVLWSETKTVNFTFTQGVFSKTQLALLTNCRLISYKNPDPILLTQREQLESDDDGTISLSKLPFKNLRVRDVHDYSDVHFTKTGDREIKISQPYRDVLVDYEYQYSNQKQVLTVGRELLSGYLALEAKTRTVDDITGNIKTAVIKIPKLKIDTRLQLTLGDNVPPVSGAFSAVGYPEGKKGEKKVMEIILLEEEIDSDIQ